MSRKIQRTHNRNDAAAVNAGITLNTSTSVKIADANEERIFININNNDNTSGFWLKLQAASVDDDKKGIFITNKIGSKPYWEMPKDNIYTGEISAIAIVDNPVAYVTEY